MLHRAAIAALAVCALAVSACAPVSSNPVTLEYTPPNFLTPAPGAEGVAIRIVVDDLRSDKTRLGDVLDNSGATIAPILAAGSVTDTIAQAIASGLGTRGFNVTPAAPAVVRVDLTRFDCTFQSGMLSGSASARMTMNVQVIAPDGKPVYAAAFSGEGDNGGFEDSSSDNAKPALDRALNDAVNRLIGDPGFVAALERASRVAT
ncbi:MAG TPA: YajG family lipoprotein [Candidatus Binataceae bacterium]|nr:YajG family lipoprotein [Candidatus Binataceae bacterium]